MYERYTCELPLARKNQQIANILRSVALGTQTRFILQEPQNEEAVSALPFVNTFCARLLLVLVLTPGICRGGQEPANDPITAYAGDSACANSHHGIYESYQKTVMAHASGPVTGNVIPDSSHTCRRGDPAAGTASERFSAGR
jgi:hypothetical protein